MIFEKLKAIIAEQLNFDPEAIKPESDIVKDIGADSLDIVEMLMQVEEIWNITIDDDAVEVLKTVQDVINYIEKNAK